MGPDAGTRTSGRVAVVVAVGVAVLLVAWGALSMITSSPGSPHTITLWHCGVDPTHFDERTWIVPDPPFDATNAPATFSGMGTMRLLESDRALYVDHGGASLRFVPRPEGWEPPLCA